MGMSVGAPVIVEVSEDNSKITIMPVTETLPIRGRHRIEDLIAESAPNAFSEAYYWGKADGKEVL